MPHDGEKSSKQGGLLGGGIAGTDNISAQWVMKLDELNTAGECLLIERDLIWRPGLPQTRR